MTQRKQMLGLSRVREISLVLIASACSAGSGKVDSNLECAALIRAANHLSAQGQIETDPAFDRQALVSSMTHLNAYAIPSGLREAEAFEQVNAVRAELIGATSATDILDRARTCIRNTPGQ